MQNAQTRHALALGPRSSAPPPRRRRRGRSPRSSSTRSTTSIRQAPSLRRDRSGKNAGLQEGGTADPSAFEIPAGFRQISS